jgi:hypothetical protein
MWACDGTPCYGGLGTGVGQSDFAVQLHASSLRLTTAYSLENYTVQPIKVTEPHSTIEYSAANLLSYLNVVFGDNGTVIDYTLAQGVIAFYEEKSNNYTLLQKFGTSVGIEFLRNVMALPLYSSSTSDLGEPLLDNLTTGYFVKNVYRLTISPFSLYTFTILSTILLGWSAVALVYCWRIGNLSPNMTQYPELDFAAQCCTSPNSSECLEIGEEIRELNSSISTSLTNWVKPKMIFLRSPRTSSDIENG